MPLGCPHITSVYLSLSAYWACIKSLNKSLGLDFTYLRASRKESEKLNTYILYYLVQVPPNHSLRLKLIKNEDVKMITLNLHQAIAFLLAKATWCPKINRVFLRPIPSFFVRHYRLIQSRLNEKGQFKIQSYFKVISINIVIRRFVESTDQAYPSCFYFIIS